MNRRVYWNRVFQTQAHVRHIPHPEIVKAQLPKSAFTRKGPGILKALWRALWRLTPAQRRLCRLKGWDRGMLKGWK